MATKEAVDVEQDVGRTAPGGTQPGSTQPEGAQSEGTQPEGTEPPGTASGGRRWTRAAVAIGVPTAVTAAHAALYGQWIEDDAGITFAYARSLTSGYGLVLQPGDTPVEGFSNPLWLAVLALGRLVGLFDRGSWFGVPDIVAFPKLVALACCAGVFACMWSVARRVAGRPVLVTAVAGSVTACVPSFVIWSFSGLENALYALLVVGLAAVLARASLDGRLASERTATVCGLLAAGAVLTRPDGLMYTLAFPAVITLAHRRDLRAAGPTVRGLINRYATVVAVPTAAYLVLRAAVFGDWLPNTARAKEQGLPTPAGLNQPAQLVAYAGWLLVAIALVAVVVTITRPTSNVRTAVAVLCVPLGLAVAAYALLDRDWMPQARFASPVWPLAALIGTLAVGHVMRGQRPRPRTAVAVLSVVALGLTIANWAGAAVEFRDNPTAPICESAQVNGYLMNAYAEQLGLSGASFLSIDAGGMSLTSQLHFVDYAGLNDATLARFREAGDGPGLRDYVFDQVRPVFVRVGDGFTGEAESGITRDLRLYDQYVPIELPATTHLFVGVRRDAVRDPGLLDSTRLFAARAVQQVQASRVRGGRLGWICPATLRPEPYRLPR